MKTSKTHFSHLYSLMILTLLLTLTLFTWKLKISHAGAHDEHEMMPVPETFQMKKSPLIGKIEVHETQIKEPNPRLKRFSAELISRRTLAMPESAQSCLKRAIEHVTDALTGDSHKYETFLESMGITQVTLAFHLAPEKEFDKRHTKTHLEQVTRSNQALMINAFFQIPDRDCYVTDDDVLEKMVRIWLQEIEEVEKDKIKQLKRQIKQNKESAEKQHISGEQPKFTQSKASCEFRYLEYKAAADRTPVLMGKTSHRRSALDIQKLILEHRLILSLKDPLSQMLNGIEPEYDSLLRVGPFQYLFKNEHFTVYDFSINPLEPQAVRPIRSGWRGLIHEPEFDGKVCKAIGLTAGPIRAALPSRDLTSILFLNDREFVEFNLKEGSLVTAQPIPIEKRWPGFSLKRIDAVLHTPDFEKTYFIERVCE